MKISDINPSDYNPRKISDQALVSLKKSMAEFGDLSGIVFNVKTGRIVGGHQRVKIFDPGWKIVDSPLPRPDGVGTISVGHIETPYGRWQYRKVNWPEKKEMAANVAANKHGGEWDYPKLKDLLVELDDGDYDFDLTGFDEKELKDMIDYEPKEDQRLEEKICHHCGKALSG